MSALLAASLGGLVSFLSTSAGAVGGQLASRATRSSSRWSFSVDFALGIMVSASAFSLIGPAAMGAASLATVTLAIAAGMAFVFLLKGRAHSGHSGKAGANPLLLASVLMLHNFPEGLASGAALAGLGWSGSLPILGGISLQNIPEGALMVMCLRALGWKPSYALLGGVGSGLVEMAGGVLAGVLLHSLEGILPALLAFAGGAMVTSVLLELHESGKAAAGRVFSTQFAGGFLLLPALQLAI